MLGLLECLGLDLIFFDPVPKTSFRNTQQLGGPRLDTLRLFEGVADAPPLKLLDLSIQGGWFFSGSSGCGLIREALEMKGKDLGGDDLPFR